MDIDLQALKRNDQASWSDFFVRFDPLLRSIVSWPKWRFPQHVAEEVAQDIRVALPRSLGSFKGESSLDHFIKRIGINICVSRIRRLVRERSRFVNPTPADGDDRAPEWDPPAGREFDPVAAIVDAERAAEARKLVDQLEATCRDAIRMFYLHDLSYEEMSARLGIAVNTVGSRLAKCREKLRGLFKDSGLTGEEGAVGRRH